MSKILVVDDDLVHRRMLRTRLEGLGHTVSEAPGGTEGLRMARKIRPHLIFLDILMPDMNGLDVCRELRERPSTRAVPVVFVSGYGRDIGKIFRGRDDSFDCHTYLLEKPWDPTELREITEDLLLIPSSHPRN